MSKQIQIQASKVWQTVTDPATAASYQQTLSLTWAILKETGYLIWLVICLGLVFGDWIWKTGYRTGWATREWINNLDRPSANELFSVTGKNLLEVGKTGAVKAISTAKEQLGLENDELAQVTAASEPIEVVTPISPMATSTAPSSTSATEPINEVLEKD